MYKYKLIGMNLNEYKWKQMNPSIGILSYTIAYVEFKKSWKSLFKILYRL